MQHGEPADAESNTSIGTRAGARARSWSRDPSFQSDTVGAVRALVLSNMLADAGHPERGRFVRDQVDALRELEGLSVELYEFPPGRQALARAAGHLRKRYRGERLDVVHAHFGLTAWPALAVRARGRALTRARHRRAPSAHAPGHARGAAHGRTCSPRCPRRLSRELPGRRARERAQVLPCGVDMKRFKAMSRARAWDTLNLEPQTPCLLFPADPARPEKRYDRAIALAEAVGARLLTLGGVEPEHVPLYVNAASAVIVPSDREGFGLAVLEALACDVPVLATPVGVHGQVLEGLEGVLCAPFELERWRAALTPHLSADDPRIAGRARAECFSATRMAERVAAAWCSLVADAG